MEINVSRQISKKRGRRDTGGTKYIGYIGATRLPPTENSAPPAAEGRIGIAQLFAKIDIAGSIATIV
jgi:hypothetical protein